MSSINENNENNDSSDNTTYSYEFTVYPNTINQNLLDIFNIFENRISANVVQHYNFPSDNIINDVQTYVNSTELPRNIAQSPMLTIPAFDPNSITFNNPSSNLTSILEEPPDNSTVQNSGAIEDNESAEPILDDEDDTTTEDALDSIEEMPDNSQESEANETQTQQNLNRNNGGISWDIPNSPIRNPIYRRRRINMRLQNLFDLVYQQNLENQILNQVLQQSFEEEQEKQLIDMARELDINKVKLSDCEKKYCDCRICLCDYEENDEIGILPCKHAFHFTCIQEWGKRKPNCPYCDVEIPVVKPNDDRVAKKQKTN